jgi:hypothetical protein
MEITLKNKCLYAIIPISFCSITICNLLIDFPSYTQVRWSPRIEEIRVYASQPECIKIKVVPVHVVKACGVGGRAPFILNFFASWRRWSGSRLSCLPERKASPAWVSEPAWMLWRKETPLANHRRSEILKSSVRGLITIPNVFSKSQFS